MCRGNQNIQLVKVLNCKLPTKGKQLPAFPLKVGPVFELRSLRWEARCKSYILMHKCVILVKSMEHIPSKS